LLLFSLLSSVFHLRQVIRMPQLLTASGGAIKGITYTRSELRTPLIIFVSRLCIFYFCRPYVDLIAARRERQH